MTSKTIAAPLIGHYVVLVVWKHPVGDETREKCYISVADYNYLRKALTGTLKQHDIVVAESRETYLLQGACFSTPDVTLRHLDAIKTLKRVGQVTAS